MVAPFEMNPTLKRGGLVRLCMTNRKEILPAGKANCSACGTAFGCNPAGQCWCAEEAVQLPMPEEGATCLCPACLRKATGEQQRSAADAHRS